MSLSDAGRQWRRRIATAAILAAAALVSACTVQPVYGPTAGGGGTVEATLARIDIDPVNTRIAQQVRNKLIFGLTGGGGVTNPVYRMKLVVTSQEIALGITREESAPVYSVIVSSTYEISRIDTGEIVLRATSRGTASYDRVNQIFANVRARVNAEDEAAGVVADDIRLRIAAATARGVI